MAWRCSLPWRPYTRYGSQLTKRQKQLAIIIALRDVHYGWTHHAPQARAVGVTEGQLQRLREGRTPRDMGATERALCDYALAGCGKSLKRMRVTQFPGPKVAR